MGAGGGSFFPPATQALKVMQQPVPQVVFQKDITGQT